ncbi:hypothetical protein SLA2020_487030 [Shorea laevis]
MQPVMGTREWNMWIEEEEEEEEDGVSLRLLQPKKPKWRQLMKKPFSLLSREVMNHDTLSGPPFFCSLVFACPLSILYGPGLGYWIHKEYISRFSLSPVLTH